MLVSSSLTIATMKKQIPIERIRQLIAELKEFDAEDLSKVELTENGKVIPISPEILEEWRFIGLSNYSFIELEFWNGTEDMAS